MRPRIVDRATPPTRPVGNDRMRNNI